MKSYKIKLNVDDNKVVIEIPERFIGKKVEIQITEVPQKRPMKKSLLKKGNPMIFETITYTTTKLIDIVDDFPTWFNSNSLDNLDDSINNF
jgi:hypothetical protein